VVVAWRTSIRAAVAPLLVAAVAFGLYVMFADYPDTRAPWHYRSGAVVVGFSCRPGSSLVLSSAPLLDVIVDAGGDLSGSYSADLELEGSTHGDLPCEIGVAPLAQDGESPFVYVWAEDRVRDAADPPEPTEARADPHGVFWAVVPLQPTSGGDRVIHTRFGGKNAVVQAGWGRWRTAFYLSNGGPPELGMTPLSAHLPADDAAGPSRGGAAALRLKLTTATWSDIDTITDVLPSTGTTDMFGGAIWDVTDPGGVYMVTLENSATRFWAEHAIDLVTLALAVLLGALLATRPPSTGSPSVHVAQPPTLQGGAARAAAGEGRGRTVAALVLILLLHRLQRRDHRRSPERG
jgi:hypothetical protein